MPLLMAAWLPLSIQVAGVAADQRTTREYRLRQRLRRTVVDRAGTVADALAAFDMRADGRVGLPALHFFERAHPRVLVVQADHEAERDLVVFQVVQEAAAEGVVFHWPACGVDHQAGLGLGRVDFPQFLDADGEGLRVLAGVQLVLIQQLAAQVTTRAFREDGVLAQQLHAELEVLSRLTILADPHVARGDTAHGTLVVVQHFRCSKAREDFHAQRFGLRGHPLDHVRQRDDVAAVVVEVARHQPVGCTLRAGFAQEEHIVTSHGLAERGAVGLPVGQQFGDGTRVHHGARENVRAWLGTLFQYDDGHVLAGLGGALLDPDRRRQASGAAADDHNVVLHGLSGTVLFEELLLVHRCLVACRAFAYWYGGLLH